MVESGVAFGKKGFVSGQVFNLSPREAYELCLENAVIVDVREDYLNTFKTFDVPDILLLPMSTFKIQYHALPTDIPLIFADSSGIHSREAFLFLKELGWTNIANLAGGLVEWERDGIPIRVDEFERLTGSCMCQLRRRRKK
jgi:rhodanese-related sulfurtransferase